MPRADHTLSHLMLAAALESGVLKPTKWSTYIWAIIIPLPGLLLEWEFVVCDCCPFPSIAGKF